MRFLGSVCFLRRIVPPFQVSWAISISRRPSGHAGWTRATPSVRVPGLGRRPGTEHAGHVRDRVPPVPETGPGRRADRVRSGAGPSHARGRSSRPWRRGPNRATDASGRVPRPAAGGRGWSDPREPGIEGEDAEDRTPSHPHPERRGSRGARGRVRPALRRDGAPGCVRRSAVRGGIGATNTAYAFARAPHRDRGGLPRRFEGRCTSGR